MRGYRIVAEDAPVTGVFGRFKCPAWGGGCGKEGSPNYIELIHADGRRHIAGKVGRYKLKRGEVARMVTGTGGGYGNPLERPIEEIADDLKNGYITPEMAIRDYGVTINENNGEIRRGVQGRVTD
jgi:N-methylhydantoinase B